MSGLRAIKKAVKTNPVLKPLIYDPYWFIRRLTVDRALMREEAERWERRNQEVMSCQDNAHIPRVPDAGVVRDGLQIMHNGLKIKPGSYYGSAVTKMLTLNKGVHEPQEEWVFQEVLKHIKPNAVMMELGAYWGFYSMWFHSKVPGARTILVEPETANLEMGKGNFAINGYKGEFLQAFVGDKPATSTEGMRTVCVDELVELHGITHLDILHADIQGFEVHMLDGARKTLERRMIDYVFISTHSQQLHADCIRILKEHGFEIIADADLEHTYSYDGLIAARLASVPGQGFIPVARKPLAAKAPQP